MRYFLAALSTLAAAPAIAEEPPAYVDWVEAQPRWGAPIKPFRVIGNVFYVGTEGLGVYLIAGDQGHYLIDGGLPGYEQQVIDNIEKLGFDIKDVKFLLNTHAHFDHSGGLAKLKEASGAELVASAGDVSALEGGFYLGFEDNAEYAAPPVSVDLALHGDPIKLKIPGAYPVRLYGYHTPGHSRGCTSWRLTVEEGEERYDVLIFCSATVAANKLVPEQYEGIVDDYRETFRKTAGWEPDVFLSNHTEVFGLKEARERQKAGDPLAFVNRGAFQKYIAAQQRAFEKALAEQQEAAARP